ncbi:MAG: ABC transporter substrate-binding protein [Spirulina sp.]
MIIPLLLGFIAAFLLKGCSIGSDRLTPIRVGIHPWPGYDVTWYAQETGLFEKRGLKAEFVEFDTNQDESRSLMRGRVDVAFLPLWEIMQLDPEENTPVFIMVTDISHGSDGLVARQGIESVKQLQDKIVAAKFGTASHLILLEALQLHQMQPEDVKIEDISNQVAVQALREGKIDAAAVWEPILSQTAQEIGGSIPFTTKDVDSLLIDGLATPASYLENHQDELTQFILVWFDLMRAIEVQPDVVFDSVGRLLGQTRESFAKNYSGLKKGDIAMNRRMFAANGRLQEAAREIVKLLHKDPRHNKTIDEDVKIDADRVTAAIEIWENQENK